MTQSRPSGRRPLGAGLVLGQLQAGLQADLGQLGELPGHRRQVDGAGDVVDGDAQDLLVLVAADRAQPQLQQLVGVEVAAGRAQPVGELRPHRLPAPSPAPSGSRPMQQVEQLGGAHEPLGEEVGGAEEREQQAGHPPVLAHEPEVGLAVAEGGGEVAQVGDGLVRVGGAEGVGEERRPPGRGPPAARRGGRRAMASMAAMIAVRRRGSRAWWRSRRAAPAPRPGRPAGSAPGRAAASSAAVPSRLAEEPLVRSRCAPSAASKSASET